jgi:hypothetical protein
LVAALAMLDGELADAALWLAPCAAVELWVLELGAVELWVVADPCDADDPPGISTVCPA